MAITDLNMIHSYRHNTIPSAILLGTLFRLVLDQGQRTWYFYPCGRSKDRPVRKLPTSGSSIGCCYLCDTHPAFHCMHASLTGQLVSPARPEQTNKRLGIGV